MLPGHTARAQIQSNMDEESAKLINVYHSNNNLEQRLDRARNVIGQLQLQSEVGPCTRKLVYPPPDSLREGTLESYHISAVRMVQPVSRLGAICSSSLLFTRI
jgi:hypothetical protein